VWSSGGKEWCHSRETDKERVNNKGRLLIKASHSIKSIHNRANKDIVEPREDTIFHAVYPSG
jgi:hypothetical protein